MSAKSDLNVLQAIQWHEGMMVAPHHFQQQDLRLRQLLNLVMNLNNPYLYGLSLIKYDPVILPEGILRLLTLRCLLPDGEVINYKLEKDAPTLEISLTKYKSEIKKEFIIWCGIPILQNDVSPLDQECPRYKPYLSSPISAFEDKANVLAIPKLRPLLKLYIAKEPDPYLSSIPIMKICAEKSTFKASPFIPPILDFSEENSIIQIIRSIAQKLHNKEKTLIEIYKTHVGTQKENTSLNLLNAVRSSIPLMDFISHEFKLHPFVVYQYLLQIMSHLSNLKSFQKFPRLGQYDHNNIEATFSPLLSYLTDCLNIIAEHYTFASFDQHNTIFSKTVNSTESKLLIGIKFPDNYMNKIDWIKNAVIVSESVFEKAIEQRIIGAKRDIINAENYPLGLINSDDLLIEVDVDGRYINNQEKLYIVNPMDEESPIPITIYLCEK